MNIKCIKLSFLSQNIELKHGNGRLVLGRKSHDERENCRYYLKNNMTTDTLVPDDLAIELLKESQVSLLQLNAAELAAQLTLRDFHYFHEIEPTEYIDDLFDLNSTPQLATFSKVSSKHLESKANEAIVCVWDLVLFSWMVCNTRARF